MLKGTDERAALLGQSAHHKRDSNRFALVVAINVVLLLGLAYTVYVSQQTLALIESQDSATTRLAQYTAALDKPPPTLPFTSNSDVKSDAKVLVVYANGPHLDKLTNAVVEGISSVLVNKSDVRTRPVSNASFTEDVLWADAVILGSHVINANVEPKMTEFLKTWSLQADLSHKIGAVFVTGGGISAGEELTMVNLLHSMMIFRMIIVGGEKWTSAFGASAVVAEGPFKSWQSDEEDHLSSLVCHPSDPNDISDIFRSKAIGLGKRVASLASLLHEHVAKAHL